MLDQDFAAILICPRSKQPLVYFPRGAEDGGGGEAEGFLLSPAAHLRYRIVAGVPCLLPEEAQTLTAQETVRLLERARALGLRVPT